MKGLKKKNHVTISIDANFLEKIHCLFKKPSQKNRASGEFSKFDKVSLQNPKASLKHHSERLHVLPLKVGTEQVYVSPHHSSLA